MSSVDRNTPCRRVNAWVLSLVMASTATLASAQTLFDDLGWAYASMNPMPSFVERREEVHVAGLGSLVHAQRYAQLLHARRLVPRRAPDNAADRRSRPRGGGNLGMRHVPLPERARSSGERGSGRPRQSVHHAADARLQERVASQQRFDEDQRAIHDRVRCGDHARRDRAGGDVLQLDEVAAVDRSNRNRHRAQDPCRGRRAPAARRQGSAAREPIGKRIIEMPKNVEGTEIVRDPRVGWIAYAPVGASHAAKRWRTDGEQDDGVHDLSRRVVRRTGRSCRRLRGRSPSYIAPAARRLQVGRATRRMVGAHGSGRGDSERPRTFSNVSAYLASLPPRRLARETSRAASRCVARIADTCEGSRRPKPHSAATPKSRTTPCAQMNPREIAGIIVFLQQPEVEARLLWRSPAA